MSGKKPWSEEAINLWHQELNLPAQPGCVGSDSRRKFLWLRSCRLHAAELTVQAANKDAFAHCIYCSKELPAGFAAASDAACEVGQLLQRQAEVQLIITEAKVLNGTFGGFDFSLLLPCPSGSGWRRLEIDYDGEQHFGKGFKETSPGQQQAADKRKDKAAWRQGRCVLRLHHADRKFWADRISHAVRRAMDPTPKEFLFYTPSYNKRQRCKAL